MVGFMGLCVFLFIGFEEERYGVGCFVRIDLTIGFFYYGNIKVE